MKRNRHTLEQIIRKLRQARLCIAIEKFWSLRKSVLPEFLEATSCKLGVTGCVLNVLVSQIVLD
jgi:hypothetical protein